PTSAARSQENIVQDFVFVTLELVQFPSYSRFADASLDSRCSRFPSEHQQYSDDKDNYFHHLLTGIPLRGSTSRLVVDWHNYAPDVRLCSYNTEACSVPSRMSGEELGHPPAAEGPPGSGAPLVLLKAAWGGLCGVSLRPLVRGSTVAGTMKRLLYRISFALQ
ncbi:MAG: hypothetical protein LC641_05665, partial [Spirochaeta sp.]|nr:hypothetical protein [Spirochaeta sp.]